MRVHKVSYTEKVPEGAEPALTRGGKPAVRVMRDGKWLIAPLNADGTRCRFYSPYWYGWVKGRRVKLCRDKAASEAMLTDLWRQAERGERGLTDPHAAHKKVRLADHVDAFRDALALGMLAGRRRKAPKAKYVQDTVQRVRLILLDRCGFKRMQDIDARKVQMEVVRLTAGQEEALPPPSRPDGYTCRELAAIFGIDRLGPLLARTGVPVTGSASSKRRVPVESARELARHRSRGAGEGTAGAYARDLRRFGRWLVKSGRLPADPLADLAGAPCRDGRHDRRPLTADEALRLLEAAWASRKVLRGLTGEDRWALYLVAMTTGFRASELAALVPERFRLDGTPVVVLLASETKNGKPVRQPIAPEVAEVLGPWLASKPAGLPLWPGTWVEKPVAMFRADLAAAGIAYVTPGPEGTPVYADFHSTRHSFIAGLHRAGVPLPVAMQLARHGDPKLTAAVYGRAQAGELAEAVGKLEVGRRVGAPCRALAGADDGERGRATEGAEATVSVPTAGGRPNPFGLKVFEGERGRAMPPSEPDQQPQQTGVPFIIRQQVQPALRQAAMQSQQPWIMSQHFWSPEVQVRQHPSLVISTLQSPMVMLQVQTTMPFIMQQTLHMPPAIIWQRFCIMAQAAGSVQVQVIFMPPWHFSTLKVQRGTITMFGDIMPAAPVAGVPAAVGVDMPMADRSIIIVPFIVVTPSYDPVLPRAPVGTAWPPDCPGPEKSASFHRLELAIPRSEGRIPKNSHQDDDVSNVSTWCNQSSLSGAVMPVNRIQSLLNPDHSLPVSLAGAACGFVPCPAPLLSTLPVEQVQLIQEIYRVARERADAVVRHTFRLPAFSRN